MSGLNDAMSSLSAVANLSDAEARKQVKPQYDADMAQYEKDLKSYEPRKKAYEADMVAHQAKLEQHAADMVKYDDDMAAWNASKNWFGRTKLPCPVEPTAPKTPPAPPVPQKPDSVEKRIEAARASARELQRIMQSSITY